MLVCQLKIKYKDGNTFEDTSLNSTADKEVFCCYINVLLQSHEIFLYFLKTMLKNAKRCTCFLNPKTELDLLIKCPSLISDTCVIAV